MRTKDYRQLAPTRRASSARLRRPSEKDFDDLTSLAANICDAPMAAISIVYEDRVWLKSTFGLSMRETPRAVSFCAHAITGPDLFIVSDAAMDQRFANNPLVIGQPHVRFYAGAPLITADGNAIGALCVMDRVPRELSNSAQEALRILSRQIMSQLDLRKNRVELVEGEDRLLRVFANGPIAASIIRLNDREIVDVNDAFSRLFGWTRHEILGLHSEDLKLVNEDSLVALRSLLSSQNRLSDEEVEMRTRDGQSRQILFGAENIEWHDEPHSINTFVDIAAGMNAKIASSRLAAIVESSDDAIIGMDVDGIITSWNRGASSIFGYTNSEAIGTSIQVLAPDDRAEEEALILNRIVEGESLPHFQTVRRRKDAVLIDVSVTVSPIKDRTGRIVGASRVARDITGLKRSIAAADQHTRSLLLRAFQHGDFST